MKYWKAFIYFPAHFIGFSMALAFSFLDTCDKIITEHLDNWSNK